MGRIERRPLATRDLKDIWRYIAADFLPAAEKWAARLEAICAELADQPQNGRPRPDLGDDLRSVPFGSNLIVYRAPPDGIELIRILHGASDLREIFFN